MKKLVFPIGLAIIVGIAACSSMRVSVDYDQEVSFAQYKVFKWIPYKPKVGPRRLLDHTLTEKRIKSAVERELAAKGIEKTTGEKPDFLIAFHIGAQNKVDVNTYGYRYGPRGRHWGRHVEVHRYKEGTLILDFVDSQSKQLVWRGTAVGAVRRPEDLGDKLSQAVEKILERFPPE